jgi:hypothetical protein
MSMDRESGRGNKSDKSITESKALAKENESSHYYIVHRPHTYNTCTNTDDCEVSREPYHAITPFIIPALACRRAPPRCGKTVHYGITQYGCCTHQ